MSEKKLDIVPVPFYSTQFINFNTSFISLSNFQKSYSLVFSEDEVAGAGSFSTLSRCFLETVFFGFLFFRLSTFLNTSFFLLFLAFVCRKGSFSWKSSSEGLSFSSLIASSSELGLRLESSLYVEVLLSSSLKSTVVIR